MCVGVLVSVWVCWQALQVETGRRRQREREKSFQAPVENKKSVKKEEGEGEGEKGGRVEVAEVKRKVKEAMKKRRKHD